MNDQSRRRVLIANRLHRNMVLVVLVAVAIPALIVSIALYSLIFSITAWQIGFPEQIAMTLLPALKQVNFAVVGALPICIVLILIWAVVISHRIVGPVDRLSREVGEIAAGKKQGPIKLRKKDALYELAENINKLIK
ncbi:MAG: hypothetical protein ABIB11_05405 [Candidatus Omnitrophota bacterium]